MIYYYWSGGPAFWLFTIYDRDEMADLSTQAASGTEGAREG